MTCIIFTLDPQNYSITNISEAMKDEDLQMPIPDEQKPLIAYPS